MYQLFSISFSCGKHFAVVAAFSHFSFVFLDLLFGTLHFHTSLSFPLFEFQPRLAVSKGLVKPASEAAGGVEASPTRGAGGSTGGGAQQHQAAGGGADPAVIRYRHRSSIPVRSVINTG